MTTDSMFRRGLPRALVALGVALLLPACSGVTDPDLDLVGTIALTEVGCWGIQTSNELYEPDALAEEFRVEGLKVHFEGDMEEAQASICSIGPYVKIRFIERVAQ